MRSLSTFRSPVSATTLVELLRWRAMQQADQPVYTFLRHGEVPEGNLTYSQLERRALAIGAWLQKRGMASQPVLLLLPPGLEYVTAFFGCTAAGAIAVPIYPPTSARTLPRLQAILTDTQAQCILTTAEMLPTLQQYFGQMPEGREKEFIAVDAIPDEVAGSWSEPEVSGKTVALLQYTSGSIGTPKGVMVTHSNLLHNTSFIAYQFRFIERIRVVSWLPPYHDMGLIGGIIYPMTDGGHVILMSPMAFLQRPFRWLQALSQFQATISVTPNFAFDLCCRKISPTQVAQLDLSHCQAMITGSELVRPETIQRFEEQFGPCGFKRGVFMPSYGLAESTLMTASNRPGEPTVPLVVSKQKLQQGRACCDILEEKATNIIGYNYCRPDQRIVIVHPETHRQCAPGEMGEIWTAGPSVAQGYWQKPKESQETFHAYLAESNEGPFLRTGDLGFLYDTVLYVTGRLKDVIIIRGTNYYPQDIETTVEQCDPAIRPGCSVAFSVEEGGQEHLVILTEIDPHYRPSAQPSETSEQMNWKVLDGEKLIRTIQQTISEQHDLRAARVVLLKAGSVLKTSSGKLRRQACRTAFLAGDLKLWNEEADGTAESLSILVQPVAR
ncbi:MAG TPA: fatty acyl-AMP ligase [Ktedonobacteraceae bacterium]|nr:fatty acyl-AMP ligase [Ktedonobacteraceae bacterium]